MMQRSTSVTFRGLISYGQLEDSGARTLVLDDSALTAEADLATLAASLGSYVQFQTRPNSDDVATLADRVRAQEITRLVAIGSGALIDAAKLTLLRVEEAGRKLELVFIPCGSEPYRAVAQFAVVDEPDGSRPTVVDPRFAVAEVGILPWLLERLPEHVLATAALDTSVQAIESLLSSRATPMTRLLATSAFRAATRSTRSDPETLLTASFLAVEAFSITRLGLAHAVASPLGAELGITHDTINGVLGEPLLDFWGETACKDLRLELGEGDTRSLTQRLRELRVAARLPASLEELGASWSAISRILPSAAKSSGIATLSAPVGAEELESFAHRAWKGFIGQEAIGAEPT